MAQIDGGAANDVLTGTADPDTISGADGSDTLSGLGGDDALYGDLATIGNPPPNYGDDLLSGGDGSDFLAGGLGLDTLNGGAGDDTLVAGIGYDAVHEVDGGVTSYTFGHFEGLGTDSIDGGDGVDTLYVYQGRDPSPLALDNRDPSHVNTLYVGGAAHGAVVNVEQLVLELGSGADTVFGGPGADTLDSGGGADRLHGGGGDDVIGLGAGDQLLDGGDGDDTVILAAVDGVRVDLSFQGIGQVTGAGIDTLVGIENLDGSLGSDWLGGDGGDNLLQDHLAGADTLFGGAGDDTLSIVRGLYTLEGDPGASSLAGGDGNDLISFDADANRHFADTALLSGGAGDDTITALGLGSGTLSGGDGNDHIVYDGVGGNYQISLGAGQDTLALAGSDGVFHTGAGVVVTDFATGAGGDVLDLSAWIAGAALIDYDRGTNPFADGHLALEQVGADTVLLADQDGGGDQFSTLLTFSDTSKDAFVAANFGGFTLPAAGQQAGLSGDDTLIGGAGDDTLDGGEGDDTAVFLNVAFASARFAYAPGGTITVSSPAGVDTLVGIEHLRFSDGLYDVGSDGRLIPDAGLTVSAPAGTDGAYLQGGNYDDTVIGGAGADSMEGGYGSDLLRGEGGSDTVVYRAMSRDYTQTLSDGAGKVFAHVGADQGVDTLNSVDAVQFQDGVLSFDPDSAAAQVYRLYDTALGRAPDFYGEAAWTSALEHGTTLQQLADLFTAGSEFQARFAGTTDAQFVTAIYEDALHRAPDAAGLQAWADQLDSGALTRSQLVALFSEGDEHRALTTPAIEAHGLWTPDPIYEDVEFVYQAAFGRPSDDAGAQHWAFEIEQGRLDFHDLIVTATQSQEFLDDTAGKTDAQLVTWLYETALGREPDPGGLANWTAVLDHGGTIAGLVNLFAQGAELQGLVEARLEHGWGDLG